MSADDIGVQNTDREIWRGPDEGCGDYYADSLHITQGGGLGINCGGTVYVKPIREWHRLAGGNITIERPRETELRQALEQILDAIDDMRLVSRLKEIERIAVKALVHPALKTAKG